MRWVLVATIAVIAIALVGAILFLFQSEQEQVEPQPTPRTSVGRTVVDDAYNNPVPVDFKDGSTIDVRPAILITDKDDWRLAVQFRHRSSQRQSQRTVLGRVKSSQIAETRMGDCFASKVVPTGAIVRDSVLAVKVIACTHDNGDITLGIQGYRANEHGDKGERFITTRIKKEQQRSDIWFSSTFTKNTYDLMPWHYTAPRAVPTYPRQSDVPSSSLEVDTGARSREVCDIHGGRWTGGRCLKYHQRPIVTQSVESACRAVWGETQQYSECVSFCKSNPTLRSPMCGRR